ncbi:MAG TPA: AMP-binding protein [Thermoanaerobaculia bacterium]|nr:AMP-binding protein [Thermoanaerobaculia bacterium]
MSTSPASPPAAGFLARLAGLAQSRPDEPAMAFVSRGEEDQVLSWSELAAQVGRLGRWLRERGVAPGDVVLVLTPSPREQALGFLAAMAAGGVPSILSFPSVKQSEGCFFTMLGSVARNSRARWIVGAPELTGPAGSHPALAGLDVQGIDLPDPAALTGVPLPLEPAPEMSTARPLFLQYSSGTTGARKGIAVTEEMMAFQASSYSQALGMGPDDRVVSWVPLYHDNGLVGCFLLPLYLGAFSAHLQPFEWVADPVSFFQAAARYRATLLWSPNFAFSFCARRIAPEELAGLDLGSLRAFLSGGELVREASRREFLERFGAAGLEERHLQVCYGMAENTFIATQTELGRPVRSDTVDRKTFLAESRAVPLFETAAEAPPEAGITFFSCGRPIPGHEVRIAGGLADRRVGEVEIRSGCLFTGYVPADAAAREAAREVLTPDGWYRSGDLGYLADGELFVTGREGDMIIHRGVNLHPEDLQEVAGAVPGCKDGRAAVFGVRDEVEGTEQIVALLEPEDGTDREALARRVRDEVAATFGIGLWDVRVCDPGTLVKSTSGKLSRSGNRRLYLEEMGGRPGRGPRQDAGHVPPRDPWETELVAIWREVLEVPSIGVTDDLFLELGASSLSALSAVGEIRQRLGRDVEPHQLLGKETIERQAVLLRQEPGEGSAALVPLRGGGPGHPLYLIHPAGGSPFSYLALTRGLGPGQPVYAFRDPHLSSDPGGGPSFASIEEMAAAYLAELEAFDSHGPYALGGWSMGGLVAFEMARRLAERGRPVSLLLMLDTFPPQSALSRAYYAAGQGLSRALLHTFGAGRAFELLRGGRRMSPGEKLFQMAYVDSGCADPRVMEATFPGLCDPAELRRLTPDEMWEHVYRRLQEEGLARVVPGRTARVIRREQRLLRLHHQISSRYRPVRQPVRITYFTVRGSRSPRAWRRYSAQPLDVHEFALAPTAGLADAHLSMMQEANVALYAVTLRSLLAGGAGGTGTTL